MNERFTRYLPTVAKFERRMENQDLLLRLFRLTDVPLLYALFESGGFSEEHSARSRSFISLFSFWRWLTAIFELIYVMVVRGDGDGNVIGFIGLYNITIYKSLTLSIGIFNKEHRGKGYGKQSVKLLLERLRENATVEKVYAEVSETKLGSLSFFQAMGFNVCGHHEKKFLLEKFLKEKA